MRAAIVGADRILPSEGDRVPEKLPFKAWLPAAHLRRMGRASRLAYLSAARALENAATPEDLSELVVVVGTALGEVDLTLRILKDVLDSRGRQVSPLKVPGSVHNALAGYLSVARGLTAPTLTVSSGRLSGEAALATALDLLSAGAGRRALVVAADQLDPAWGEALERGGATEWAAALGAGILVEGAAALVLDPSPATEPRLGWIEDARVFAATDCAALDPTLPVICRVGAAGESLCSELGERCRLDRGSSGRTLAGALPQLARPPGDCRTILLGRDGGLCGLVRWSPPGAGDDDRADAPHEV